MESKKILIVDDVFEYTHIMGLLLAEKGFGIEKAHTYEQAVEYIDKENPYLAIIDVRLNESDLSDKQGIELLKYIKEKFPETRVIITGDYNELKFKDEMKRIGADAFLEKPLKPASFKEIVEKYIKEIKK